MRKILFSIVVFTIILGQTAQAQQSAQFSQYMFYGLMLNPAYSGMDNGTRIQATHRTQYAGYQATLDKGGAQNTQLISGNVTLPNNLGGAGLYIINDKLGPLGYTQVMASYAYHIPFKGGKFSVGLSAGLYNRSLDYTILRPADVDPRLKNSKESSNALDVSGGLWYKHQNFYVGISTMHLAPAKFDLGGGSTFKQERTLYITGGYHININEDLKVTPSILYKSEGGNSAIDLSGMATYTDQYFAGLSYRSGFSNEGYSTESLIFLAGLNLLKNNSLRVCYSFDGVGLLGNATALAATSHEIQLAFLLPTIPVNVRPIIRTPRYRN
jgi:type IX secretion system PorP/SprF family membrane protein